MRYEYFANGKIYSSSMPRIEEVVHIFTSKRTVEDACPYTLHYKFYTLQKNRARQKDFSFVLLCFYVIWW